MKKKKLYASHDNEYIYKLYGNPLEKKNCYVKYLKINKKIITLS